MKPYYWSEAEEHKQAEKVSSALFEYQRYLQRRNPDDDAIWRKVYGMRCDVGLIEQFQKLDMGYKDGIRRENEEQAEGK